jgi:uncharacterized protein YyaL (SSP411 family)
VPNHLAAESSPYLRQHAGNPVDWWPWCDEALALARAEGKPILLSIGYSACHWCHVMAHESFEDPATAAVMNALYVNIKVDREERPDIDKVYQLAHQALTRRGGGWPLTVFLAPDGLVPVFAGTYFPRAPRPGLPAFVQVLEGVRRWFDEKPDEVRAQNDALAAFLANHGNTTLVDVPLDDAPLALARTRIAAQFDPVHGGQRGAPKFPHAPEIEWLLDSAASPGDPDDDATSPAGMARLTLARMAAGGLQDHVGGGFFRYSVDERWEIPHFEKMLYDNALLLPLYARAAVQLDDADFADVARSCAGWIGREMLAPGGGIFSALDADSEGEEGRYYVWSTEEIRRLLSPPEFALVERRHGLDGVPNFEGLAWHLRVVEGPAASAAALGIAEATVCERLRIATARLLAARQRRVRPGLDDKILTAWNALAIAAAARAARWLPDAPLLAEAERALDFLHENLWRDGHLYACHAGGMAKFPAWLDDHAFLLDALIAMLQRRWKRRDLDWAIALADALLERFEDRDGGGFFFTAHDAERLPQRPKSFVDEALPSGNGTAARALLRLGHLVGDVRYLDAAERCLRAAWPTLTGYPQACCTMLLALGDFLKPPSHVVVRCRGTQEAQRWRQALDALCFGDATLDAYLIDGDAGMLPGVLAAQVPAAGGTAWLCHGRECLPPVTSPESLRAIAGMGHARDSLPDSSRD